MDRAANIYLSLTAPILYEVLHRRLTDKRAEASPGHVRQLLSMSRLLARPSLPADDAARVRHGAGPDFAEAVGVGPIPRKYNYVSASKRIRAVPAPKAPPKPTETASSAARRAQRLARERRRLPVVLTREEIDRIAACAGKPLYRLLIEMMYGSGLEAREVVRLRAIDVDLDQSVVYVPGHRDRPDRMTTFSPRLVDAVREQMTGKELYDLLFAGRGGRPVGVRTINKAFAAALREAGVDKPATPASLRDAFAVHLLEAGLDLGCLQRLLGHKRLASTRVYLNVYNPGRVRVRSPL